MNHIKTDDHDHELIKHFKQGSRRAMEEIVGIVPCAIMSMLSESMLPAACEVDITGLVGMLALQLATQSPSAIADWNNNYGDDPDKAVLFHCSNFPKSMFSSCRMDYQDIIAGTVGKKNTYGTCVGRLKPGPFTFARVSTDDILGQITAYVGEGALTDDELTTFGGYGVAFIPDLQSLLHYMCESGFEHHTALSRGSVGDAVAEAMDKYLGWTVYCHAPEF